METLRHGNIELQRNELHNFFISRHTKMRVSAFYEFQSERSEITTTKIFKVQIPIYFRKRFEISFLRNIRDGSQRPILHQRKKDSKHFDLLFEEKCPKEEKSENFRSFIIVASPFSRGEGGRKREADAFFFYSAASSRERLLWKP